MPEKTADEIVNKLISASPAERLKRILAKNRPEDFKAKMLLGDISGATIVRPRSATDFVKAVGEPLPDSTLGDVVQKGGFVISTLDQNNSGHGHEPKEGTQHEKSIKAVRRKEFQNVELTGKVSDGDVSRDVQNVVAQRTSLADETSAEVDKVVANWTAAKRKQNPKP